MVVVDSNRTLGSRKQGPAVIEIGQLTHAAHLLRPVATTAQAAAAAIDFVYQVLLKRKATNRQGERGVVLVIEELMDAAVIGDRDSAPTTSATWPSYPRSPVSASSSTCSWSWAPRTPRSAT